MRVAFTHNLQKVLNEEEAEFDSKEVVDAVTNALEALGHRVETIDVAWKRGHEGEMLMVATMSYLESVEVSPGLPDPRYVRWRRLGEGKWGLAITDQHLLEEVLAVLGRAKI